MAESATEVAGEQGETVNRTINTIPADVRRTTGEGGTQIKLLSNHFKLNTPRDLPVHAYRVDFDPLVESVRMKRDLIVRQQKDLFDSAIIYDGQSYIYSTKQLESEVTSVSGTRKSDNGQICITIRHTSTVPWEHPEMMRLFNTLMRKNLLSIGMIQIGRNHFDQYNRKKLDKWRIEIWPGITTSINEHDGGILMMCDIVSKIVRSETAYDMLSALRKADGAKFCDNARHQLSGKIVMVSYQNKTYRIDDVVFDRNPSSFTLDYREETISLKDYYLRQYDITIKDDRQPLLMVKPSQRQRRAGQDQPIMLVPELCLMTGLTDQMRNDFELKRELDIITNCEPNVRVEKWTTFMRKLSTSDKVLSEMATWNLTLENNPIKLFGHVLRPEKILMLGEYEGSGTQYVQKTGSFEQEIRSKNLRKPVGLDRWTIIYLRRDKDIVDKYCTTLQQVSGPLGVTLSPPKIIQLDDDRLSSYAEACRKIPAQCQLVNVIVPNTNKTRYDAMKNILFCETSMALQVVTTKTLQKKNLLAICTKICIQMSVKLGAEAWALDIPLKNLMVAGYNCHKDNIKGSSVGALVCSLNRFQTRWFSKVSYHRNSEQMSTNLVMNLMAALKEYHSLNERYPDRLIIYRADVSEGQIPYIYNNEMPQIKAALGSIISLEEIRWSLVLVTKQGHARFFSKLDNESPFINPPPGTVVDTVVTRKERYDFYLISHSVRQGTVNPTMYNIIEDTTGWQPYHHQQMAYKLCHLYFNWAGTITVPSACQYARKLAYLTATSLHREPNPKLSNYLFYL